MAIDNLTFRVKSRRPYRRSVKPGLKTEKKEECLNIDLIQERVFATLYKQVQSYNTDLANYNSRYH